jgi:hypothetical protein
MRPMIRVKNIRKIIKKVMIFKFYKSIEILKISSNMGTEFCTSMMSTFGNFFLEKSKISNSKNSKRGDFSL